jgi:hypothetical protein
MHIKLVDGVAAPYGWRDLKRDNPSIDAPQNLTDLELTDYGVHVVHVPAAPNVDDGQYIDNGGYAEVDGVWTQLWVTKPIEGYIPVPLAVRVRAERNAALVATDYMGLADYLAEAGELEYRQSLRDVPQQTGFPNNITWPTEP